MSDDLRARIAAVLRDHQPPTHVDSAGLPADEFDCCADAVMAALDEAFAPQRFLDPPPEMSPGDVAAWLEAWAEALDGDTQMRVMPPNAVGIYRRTPEQRRAYLTEHRDEALANGIPADLIDMMIADAETGDPE